MGMNNNLAGKILQFIESPEGYALKEQWALQREEIIAKGKKARNSQQDIKVWAELEGFDKAIRILHNIANYREKEEQEVEE